MLPDNCKHTVVYQLIVIRKAIAIAFLLFCKFSYAFESPLHISAAEGDVVEVQRRLKKGDDVDMPTKDERKDTPLYYALTWSHLNVVALLLEKGANPNKYSGAGYAPIHYVSKMESKNIEALKLLVAHGADINLRAKNGTSVIQSALQDGNTQVALYLLEAGANPEGRGSFDEPLICAAIAHNNIDVVLRLIEKQVNLNTNGCYIGFTTGYFPLHRAAASCSLEIVQILVASGVDINAQSAEGITAMQLAEDENCLDIDHFYRFLSVKR